MKISVPAAKLALLSGTIALAALFSLHFLSPEFNPSFRMVSEYALGKYEFVLTTFFFAWALSAFALFFAIRSQIKTLGGKIGLFFLLLAGVGMAMGGLFDVSHPLHGAAFGLGVPGLPIAAVLITLSLVRQQGWDKHKKVLLWTANLTWISLILMAVTMFLFISSFTQNGGVIDTTPRVELTLPEGTIAIVGWFNRLLVVTYIVWVIKTAWVALKLKGKK